MTLGVKVVGGPDGSRERPFLFVAPDIGSHDEEFDRCVVVDPVVDPLQPVIEPAEFGVAGIEEGDETEIAVAGVGRAWWSVASLAGATRDP